MNKKVRLEEIVKIAGRVGWKGYTVDDLRDNGPWVIGANDITTENRLDLTKAKHISREKYEESPEIMIAKNDILIVKVGSSIGKVAIVNKDIGEACINPNSVILKNCKINPYYLYYYLTSSAGQSFLKNNSSASAQSALNQTTLKEMLIELPEQYIQNNVASILNNLNSKIELNNRINAELEAMAKTLYDYWFVQFDFPNVKGKPYKTSGGKMVWNEGLKRDIPEGWDDGFLSDLGDIIGGSTPSRDNIENFYTNGTPWITPKDLSENTGNKFITKGEVSVSEKGLKSASLKILPKGTVLMSSRAPVGYMAIARDSLTTNQGFKSFVPKSDYSTSYIYYTIKNAMPEIENNASGSTFKEISGSTLKIIKVCLPKKEVILNYTTTVSSIFERQNLLELENQKLTELRDWLLPMLMNGQVRVN